MSGVYHLLSVAWCHVWCVPFAVCRLVPCLMCTICCLSPGAMSVTVTLKFSVSAFFTVCCKAFLNNNSYYYY